MEDYEWTFNRPLVLAIIKCGLCKEKGYLFTNCYVTVNKLVFVMGNSKSKKSAKEPDKFFDRAKFNDQKEKVKRKKNANPKNKRMGGMGAPPAAVMPPAPPSAPPPAPPPAQIRSFDDEAVNLMRYQMRNDADAFLLNNILLSVQFFENYERYDCLGTNRYDAALLCVSLSTSTPNVTRSLIMFYNTF